MASFNATAARQAGYDDATILQQLQSRDPSLTQSIQGASQHYSPTEIVDYISQNHNFADPAAVSPGMQPADPATAVAPTPQPAPNDYGATARRNWFNQLAPVQLLNSAKKAATTGLTPEEQKAARGQALGSLADVAGIATLPIAGSEYLGAEALGAGGRILAQLGIGGAAAGGKALTQNATTSDTLKSAGLGALTSGATAGVLEGAGGLVGAGGNKLIQSGQSTIDNAMPEGLNLTKAQQTSFFKKTGQQLVPWLKQNNLLTADPEAIKSAIAQAQGQFNTIAQATGTTVPASDLAQNLQNAWEGLASKTDPAYQNQAKQLAASANAILAKYGSGDIPVAALNDERIAQDQLVNWNKADPTQANPHYTLRNVLSQTVENATKDQGNLDALGQHIKNLLTYNESVGSKLGAGVVSSGSSTTSKVLTRAIQGAVGGGLGLHSPLAAAAGVPAGIAEAQIEKYLAQNPQAVGAAVKGAGQGLSAVSSPGLRSLYELLTTAGLNH